MKREYACIDFAVDTRTDIRYVFRQLDRSFFASKTVMCTMLIWLIITNKR